MTTTTNRRNKQARSNNVVPPDSPTSTTHVNYMAVPVVLDGGAPDPAWDKYPPNLKKFFTALNEAVGRSRVKGSNHWRNLCPCSYHDKDDYATLEIHASSDGELVFHCKGGQLFGTRCKRDDILRALALKPEDIKPVGKRSPRYDSSDWEDVTPEFPCLVCWGESWCSRTTDGRTHVCRQRAVDDEGRLGREKIDKEGNSYWVFKDLDQETPNLFPENFESSPVEQRLSPKHLEDLRRSGLSDETILAGGFHTREAYDVAGLLGWKAELESMGSALVIPYRDISGDFDGYCRVKPDNPRTDHEGRSIKYESPLGTPPRAYIPAGTLQALKDPSVRLVIVEGEKKAAKSDAEGFPTLGVGGVWSWQKKRPQDVTGQPTGERELIDDLDHIVWKARSVVIVFDSDVATNENVRWARWHLYQALVARGAVVSVVDLPQGPPGPDGQPTKIGLDDFLVLRGRDAFQALVGEAVPPENPKYTNTIGLTDTGNAKRLIREHGRDMRYCHLWGRWVIFDGSRWKEDQSGEAMRRAKNTILKMGKQAGDKVRKLREESGRLREKGPQAEQLEAELGEAEAVLNWSKKSESLARLQAMLVVAQSEEGVPVSPDDFDTDPMLLNVKNGTVDLRTGTLRPHNRGDLITQMAPVVYDPKAQAPLWSKFLDRAMGGNQKLIAFLKRAVGYSLTGRVSEQQLLFFHGRGNNGKTVFLNTIHALLGDYALPQSPEFLMVRASEPHPTERAALYRKRFVTCLEVDDGKRLSEALVKWLTGGDRILARRMREDNWAYDPTHHFFMAGNYRPRVRGQDDGIWRRILLVPFTVSVPEGERDKDLPDKLKAELSGILNWAIEGCISWGREGLNPPDEVRNATKEYREEQDRLAGFLDEACTLENGLRVGASELLRTYNEWAKTNNEEFITPAELKSLMEGRGITHKRSGKKGGAEFHGIGLKPKT